MRGPTLARFAIVLVLLSITREAEIFLLGEYYRTAVNWPEPSPAEIYDFGRRFIVFDNILYYELLVCYIEMLYIVPKTNFV